MRVVKYKRYARVSRGAFGLNGGKTIAVLRSSGEQRAPKTIAVPRSSGEQRAPAGAESRPARCHQPPSPLHRAGQGRAAGQGWPQLQGGWAGFARPGMSPSARPGCRAVPFLAPGCGSDASTDRARRRDCGRQRRRILHHVWAGHRATARPEEGQAGEAQVGLPESARLRRRRRPHQPRPPPQAEGSLSSPGGLSPRQ